MGESSNPTRETIQANIFCGGSLRRSTGSEPQHREAWFELSGSPAPAQGWLLGRRARQATTGPISSTATRSSTDASSNASIERNAFARTCATCPPTCGIALSKDESRAHVYGMPYEEWKERHQHEATASQLRSFEESKPSH